ncbi:hypothetical protein [Streptosporangium sp. NPDC051022]|uniref:hypothetical protein n=1 Tax=Streptosporangium sp. NPDC051022 TaxID=3155752 RepID=UPI00344553ED
MTITRTLTGLALAAVLASIAPTAAHASTGAEETATAAPSITWGPYTSPGRGARAAGSVAVSGEDHQVIPAAKTARVSGKLQDLTPKGSTCGWAVFRITYRTSGGNLPFKHHSVRNCSYGTPKTFSFTSRDVYQVEVKVCSEAKAAQPSVNCFYAEAWKVIYLSK